MVEHLPLGFTRIWNLDKTDNFRYTYYKCQLKGDEKYVAIVLVASQHDAALSPSFRYVGHYVEESYERKKCREYCGSCGKQ